jgi:Bacterial toxin homologue of phage lysozyme, C-term
VKSIDWAFVERLEGRKLTGYVPKDSHGHIFENSGVTIGTGIDLGHRDRGELISTFIPDALKRRLLPYVGLRGERAETILEARPLVLTEDECTALDTAIQRQVLYRLEFRFNQDSKVPFDNLPAEAQTVLMSLAWNFGANLDEKLPTGWKLATASRWDDLAHWLETTPWKQPELLPRRQKEAALLRTILPYH